MLTSKDNTVEFPDLPAKVYKEVYIILVDKATKNPRETTEGKNSHHQTYCVMSALGKEGVALSSW